MTVGLAAALAALLVAAPAGGGKGRPITRDKALEIARRQLARDAANDFVIEEEKTQDREFGWVFFYAPRAYLRSRDPGDLVPGAGPLAVERLGGATTFLSSAVPPQRAIEEFEKSWRRRRGRKR